jgi:hypothetical protein
MKAHDVVHVRGSATSFNNKPMLFDYAHGAVGFKLILLCAPQFNSLLVVSLGVVAKD